MKNTALPVVLTTPLLMLLSLNVEAESQFSISPSLLHFKYTEFSTTGSTLNKETGWIPGIQLHLSKQFNQQWSSGVEVITYGGKVDYDGHTQSGQTHSTDTNETIFKLGAHLKTPVTEDTDLVFGAKYNKWKRDIYDNNGIFGLLEIYRWWEISAGITHEFGKTDTQSWHIEAHLLKTINPTIHVDLSRADYGKTDLNLGTDWGTRLQLSWDHKHSSNWQYGFNVFYEAWNFGRSNSKATTGGTYSGTFYEPYSETRHSGLILEITKTY
ncbi:MAG: hypothetical protein OQK69_11255 [Gammaproteobacteria bacterium]|nr:hypothetical protein [Gammaproteobacteria bacterium]